MLCCQIRVAQMAKKNLGTAGTSAFPILFTKLFWKMAKKFKNFGVLGCLIAVEEMADFTL